MWFPSEEENEFWDIVQSKVGFLALEEEGDPDMDWIDL